jgi:hypothetical protein
LIERGDFGSGQDAVVEPDLLQLAGKVTNPAISVRPAVALTDADPLLGSSASFTRT